jgi:hypothetical protein
MKHRVRKIALTAHVASSVGWLGAVAAFESLAVTGLASANSLMVRAAYLAMERVTWFVIVPFACASMVSGLIMALGTKWGLFKHYWILAKFLINALSIALLLLHSRLIHLVATTAAEGPLSPADLRGTRIQLVAVAGAALMALGTATALGVFKPRGVTPYGRATEPKRSSHEALRGVSQLRTPADARGEGSALRRRLKLKVLLGALGAILLLFVVLHFFGGRHGSHGR